MESKLQFCLREGKKLLKHEEDCVIANYQFFPPSSHPQSALGLTT